MTASIVGVVLGALALMPAAAAAQTESRAWFVAPFMASTTGGDATHSSPAVGVAGGWMSKSWFGAEADLLWAPHFFEQDGFLSRRSMVTFMGNAVASWRGLDGGTPFISGGIGLLRPSLAEAGEVAIVEKNVLGWNLGGGATFGTGQVGLRVDVRYFRGLKDDDAGANAFGIDFSTFGFWRYSAGLNVRF